MKKIFKFFAALASVAAVAGGAYLVYKNFFAKEDEDFDFDDSFGDEDDMASREYVSINITTDETEEEDASEADEVIDIAEDVDAE
jgi:hypothetical protein